MTNGLIMNFQKQCGGVGGTSDHPLVLTFKFYKCPQPFDQNGSGGGNSRNSSVVFCVFCG